MIRTLKRIFFVLLLATSTGCIEKNGYYEPGQQAIIDNLTDKKWEREYYVPLENGQELDIHEICSFDITGKGYYKTITTYDNGEKEETMTYFNWAFTIPNFSIIYMDSGLYWEIKKLTKKELFVYETYEDPITQPGQTYRDYREYRSSSTKRPYK